MTERIALYGEQTEAATQLTRVFQTARCQLELAYVLETRQTSISKATRRDAPLPPDRPVKPLYLRGVNPAWIMDGAGPIFLAPSNDPAGANCPYENFPPVRACDAATPRRIPRCFPAVTDELRRRKAPAVPEPVSRTLVGHSDEKYSTAMYSVCRRASAGAMTYRGAAGQHRGTIDG